MKGGPSLSIDRMLSLFGIALAFLVIALDKAGKLKGRVNTVFLVLAFLLTLPVAVNPPWIPYPASHWIIWYKVVLSILVLLVYAALYVWISRPSNRQKERPEVSESSPVDQRSTVTNSSGSVVIQNAGENNSINVRH